MNIEHSVDQLINSLQTFKSAFPNLKDSQTSDEFSNFLREASTHLDTLANPNDQRSIVDFNANVTQVKTASLTNNRLQKENWLTDSQDVAILGRPNLKTFVEVTGVSALDASEILYGVIGANADLRDWSKIMASNNPVDAARSATAQLYNSDKEYALVKHADYGTERFENTLHDNSLASKTLIQKAGNFAEINTSGFTQIMAVSKDGLLLRGAGSSQEQVQRTAWLFGFDMPDWTV